MADESTSHSIDWDERWRRSEEDARTAPRRDFRHTLSGFDSRVFAARLRSAGQDIECLYTIFHDADGLQLWWFPLEIPEGIKHPLCGISYHGHKWNPSEGRSKQWDVVWCRFRLADVGVDPPAVEIVGWVREEVADVVLAWLGVEPDLNASELRNDNLAIRLPSASTLIRWRAIWRAIRVDVQRNGWGPSAIVANSRKYVGVEIPNRDTLSKIIKAGEAGHLEATPRKIPQ